MKRNMKRKILRNHQKLNIIESNLERESINIFSLGFVCPIQANLQSKTHPPNQASSLQFR